MEKIVEQHSIAEKVPGEPYVAARRIFFWRRTFWQLIRFGVVGIANTGIDVLTFNVLLLAMPTHIVTMLLIYNSISYLAGAVNSYLFNKYWTFHHKHAITMSELVRFAIVNGVGILLNNSVIWLAATLLHSSIRNTFLWANASKVSAIVITTVLSYLGMRFWVFAAHHHRDEMAE